METGPCDEGQWRVRLRSDTSETVANCVSHEDLRVQPRSAYALLAFTACPWCGSIFAPSHQLAHLEARRRNEVASDGIDSRQTAPRLSSQRGGRPRRAGWTRRGPLWRKAPAGVATGAGSKPLQLLR